MVRTNRRNNYCLLLWSSLDSSFKVTSEQWDGALGRCDIAVVSEPVTLGDLSVQVVSGLGMSVAASTAHPSVVTATVTAYNVLYNYHQVREALLICLMRLKLAYGMASVLLCRNGPGFYF